MPLQTATRIVSAYADQPFPIAGYHAELWRVPAGTAADTCVITPARGRFVASVIGGPFSHNLTSGGVNTTVTLTYAATTGGASDVMVLVQE